MEKNLAKTYDPKDFEDRIYEMWETNGAFRAEVDPDKKPFTIVMPPPNITGQLHMGHALDQTLQDVLTQIETSAGLQRAVAAGKRPRQHRDRGQGSRQDPQGRRPGKRRSGQRGILKESLGRGRKNSAARSRKQCRKLGDSCDWSERALHHGRGLQQGGQGTSS